MAKTNARLVAATTGTDGIADDAGRLRLRRRVVSIPVAVAMSMLNINKYNTIDYLSKISQDTIVWQNYRGIIQAVSSDAARPFKSLLSRQLSNLLAT